MKKKFWDSQFVGVSAVRADVFLTQLVALLRWNSNHNKKN